MDILEDSNIKQVLQDKTTLLPKILDIITNYVKTIIAVEFINSTVIMTQDEFNDLDKKLYESMRFIEIYGVLILNNPIALFKRSLIVNIIGNVKLRGIAKDMFYSAMNFIGDITNWDTSDVTDMNSMFYNVKKFNQELNWDISNVTDMSFMFQNARKFNQELNWNTSKVTKMEHMFHGAEKFNQELNWNTSKVTNMEHMFHSAEKFNKELYWNTSKVTNMEHMFHSAENFNKELYWNTSKVIDMSSMFHNAEKFDNSLDWNTSEVTDMKHMFWGALSFNQKLKWDTSRVTDMSRMFQNAEKFDKELEWDTSNVTNMNRMFSGATNFTKKLKWDTLNVTIDAKMFEKTPFEKLMLGYNTQMVEWFNSLDTKIKEALTISCKWYSFRFDGYLNSIYRNTVYPYNKLKSHIATILEFRDILIRSHTLFENKMCNNGVTVKNPFENVMIENKISTPAYIEKVKDVTLYIHNTITQHFYTLTHSVTVYRGIVVRENDNISLNITGVTSVTLDLKIAIYFLDPIDEKDKCYLLEFDLPVGTKIVPMDICSFYDEKEYLVIDQGVLKIYKQKICNKKIEYNSVELPIVYINAEFVPNEELLIYTSFNCNI